MEKYKLINLIQTPEEARKMKDVEEVKVKGLEKIMTGLVEDNSLPFMIYLTVASGATLGQLYDSVLASRVRPAKGLSHQFIITVVNHPDTVEALKKDLSSAEDVEAVIAFSHSVMLLGIAQAMRMTAEEIIREHTEHLSEIIKELDKRGIAPMRAVLKPLKMNERYQVITNSGDFIVSYDEHMAFTLEKVDDSSPDVPNEKLVFIGNVQEGGDVHHLDDLPIFSTHTRLLFGRGGEILMEPVYLSDYVVDVTAVEAIN